MGAKDSKRLCLPYEDAVKRMSDDEFKRVCETFKRLSGAGPLLGRPSFVQHVLGDGVPAPIAEWLYTACGGTARGIALRDLVCGLVLLTKGRPDEKIRFLWLLYCNGDAGGQITRTDFHHALIVEGCRPPDRTVASLFGVGQERVTYDQFGAWVQSNPEATVLSRWLLVGGPCVSLSSEVDAPTFYQTLAGVTHLEEHDIGELEKCFWALQGASPTGHLDLACVRAMVCPPVPASACGGLFGALDVNRDGHVDFKELCCGISAACRGPTAERIKFCFKIFDMDRDLHLDAAELRHMIQTLLFIAGENTRRLDLDAFQAAVSLSSSSSSSSPTPPAEAEEERRRDKSLDRLQRRLDEAGGLSQEEFLVWSVEEGCELVEPLLELVFQVCHVSFVLRPHCRHHEHDIVTGWLQREEKRGYHVGQFWYLISSEWWRSWLAHTTAPRAASDRCACPHDLRLAVEEGVVCDESPPSRTDSGEFASNSTNNSMESMVAATAATGADSCSLASSSGVSSSSNTSKRATPPPGPIENHVLVQESPHKGVSTLTGEGGHLRRDPAPLQHRDFELVPDSLWKALAHWYGGPLPLPRQVVLPAGAGEAELELYPLNLSIWRHQGGGGGASAAAADTWGSVVGGYGAAALTSLNTTNPVPRRYLAHTAAFSRLANVRQVKEFLCGRLALGPDDVRLWQIRNDSWTPLLLEEDDDSALQDLGVADGDRLLLEVRSKDLTWPEELGALAAGATGSSNILAADRRPTICLPPGATGLHNLGNTCFMNAALQAVSNTRPLTMYFQRDGQLCELNSANPLGTKGMVARRYAELCRELWAGSTRSVAPLKLRYCVTKHAPHLGGGGQHDSQEVLAWLLDALHEDLNRVARKQYTELKDSGGRPDEVVAEEAWQQHLARDHSVITDLFYGQLKSKVTCQTCGHESVRFDPFNLLSLPLPMESFTLCEVLAVKLDGATPVKYGVRLNSDARYRDLRERLAELCGVAAERLLLAQVAQSQVRPVANDEGRISAGSAADLYAFQVPSPEDEGGGGGGGAVAAAVGDDGSGGGAAAVDSPLARSPENNNNNNNNSNKGSSGDSPSLSRPNGVISRTSIVSVADTKLPASARASLSSDDGREQKHLPPAPGYLIAVHRKCIRQETYFLSQQKSKPNLFGVPLLLECNSTSTCQSLYEAVWRQVTRLLSPLPQSDQTNHATDCDDSLGYEFPFTLKAVLQGGQICALCHWTRFCRGCVLPCDARLGVHDRCGGRPAVGAMLVAVDWDPTALHLRYQSNRERAWIEDGSVGRCRGLHTEPIDLDHCLRAFTSEERLEAKYHCANCNDKRPATKKLQIWRLPPILIVHLKRFDCVNNKWVKTHKVVNFPFNDFDPTAYLASVPQETILRHRQLQSDHRCSRRSEFDETIEEGEELLGGSCEHTKLLDVDGAVATGGENKRGGARTRLESTSLLRTPIVDQHLRDYHQHKLNDGQDPFDLKYQLYAVVSHSGMLNGGHYISYACNPNGNWYCYNDSSCREVLTQNKQEGEEKEAELTIEKSDSSSNVKIPKIDTSTAYILFYERSGLDYKPYLPQVCSGCNNGGGSTVSIPAAASVDSEDAESELGKQLCNVQ